MMEVYTPEHSGYEPPPLLKEEEQTICVVTTRKEKVYLLQVTTQQKRRCIVPGQPQVSVLHRKWYWYPCSPFRRNLTQKDMHVPLMKHEDDMQFFHQGEQVTLVSVPHQKGPEYVLTEVLSKHGEMIIAYQEQTWNGKGYEITSQVLTPQQQADLEEYERFCQEEKK